MNDFLTPHGVEDSTQNRIIKCTARLTGLCNDCELKKCGMCDTNVKPYFKKERIGCVAQAGYISGVALARSAKYQYDINGVGSVISVVWEGAIND